MTKTRVSTRGTSLSIEVVRSCKLLELAPDDRRRHQRDACGRRRMAAAIRAFGLRVVDRRVDAVGNGAADADAPPASVDVAGVADVVVPDGWRPVVPGSDTPNNVTSWSFTCWRNARTPSTMSSATGCSAATSKWLICSGWNPRARSTPARTCAQVAPTCRWTAARNSSAPGAISRRETVPRTRSEPSGSGRHGDARSGAEQRFVREIVVARVSRAVAHVEARTSASSDRRRTSRPPCGGRRPWRRGHRHCHRDSAASRTTCRRW